MPWTHAAIIGCSVATGVGAVIRHANVEAGSSVLVIGCGGVGLNVVQVPSLLVEDDHRLRPARQQARLRPGVGATHTINAKTEDVVKRVKELTDGFGADYAFDAIGSEKTASMVVDAILLAAMPCWSASPRSR